eukprot:7828872-Pyramimonas_sp.AAC.1
MHCGKRDSFVYVGELWHLMGHKGPVAADPVRESGRHSAIENKNKRPGISVCPLWAMTQSQEAVPPSGLGPLG